MRYCQTVKAKKKFFILQLIAHNYIEKLFFIRCKKADFPVWGIKVQTG